MATELRTDSWHRYMMYRSDEQYLPFANDNERQQAAEKGGEFVASAYAEVWADNAELVQRVRQFLGGNFHWHERLAKSGSSREVAETLMSMVRGGSVVVIPEKPQNGAAGIARPRAAASSWGVDHYDETPFVSIAERYRTQLERIESERTTSKETQMDRTHCTAISDIDNVPSFHDAELVGIEHDPIDRELVLRFRRVGGELESFWFTNVIAQRIVDFAEQNVVSRLLMSPKYRFSPDEARTWVQWINSRDDSRAAPIDEELTQQYAQDFLTARQALFVLEPSCGAEMAVLCQTIWLHKQPRMDVSRSGIESLGQFHDWYLDIIATAPTHDRLTLGLYLGDRRATVTFVGVARCLLEHLAPQNIVLGIDLLEIGTHSYAEAQQALSSAETWSKKNSNHIAKVHSSVGAELIVEFDSLEIETT